MPWVVPFQLNSRKIICLKCIVRLVYMCVPCSRMFLKSFAGSGTKTQNGTLRSNLEHSQKGRRTERNAHAQREQPKIGWLRADNREKAISLGATNSLSFLPFWLARLTGHFPLPWWKEALWNSMRLSPNVYSHFQLGLCLQLKMRKKSDGSWDVPDLEM